MISPALRDILQVHHNFYCPFYELFKSDCLLLMLLFYISSGKFIVHSGNPRFTVSSFGWINQLSLLLSVFSDRLLLLSVSRVHSVVLRHRFFNRFTLNLKKYHCPVSWFTFYFWCLRLRGSFERSSIFMLCLCTCKKLYEVIILAGHHNQQLWQCKIIINLYCDANSMYELWNTMAQK